MFSCSAEPLRIALKQRDCETAQVSWGWACRRVVTCSLRCPHTQASLRALWAPPLHACVSWVHSLLRPLLSAEEVVEGEVMPTDGAVSSKEGAHEGEQTEQGGRERQAAEPAGEVEEEASSEVFQGACVGHARVLP